MKDFRSCRSGRYQVMRRVALENEFEDILPLPRHALLYHSMNRFILYHSLLRVLPRWGSKYLKTLFQCHVCPACHAESVAEYRARGSEEIAYSFE